MHTTRIFLVCPNAETCLVAAHHACLVTMSAADQGMPAPQDTTADFLSLMTKTLSFEARSCEFVSLRNAGI